MSHYRDHNTQRHDHINLNTPNAMDHKHHPQYPYHMPQDQPYFHPQHPGHYPAPHQHHAHPDHYPQGPAHPQTHDGRGFQRNPGLVIPPGTLHHKPSMTMVGGPQHLYPEHHAGQEHMHPSMYPPPHPYGAGGGYPHYPDQHVGVPYGAPQALEAGVTRNPGLVIPRGTLHARVVGPFTYRTYDGRAFFKFNYVEKEDGRWDMDIVEQPDYCGRDTKQQIIHRWPSDRGGSRICVYDHLAPQDLQTAQALSMSWAEMTWRYILTGITLDEQIAEQQQAAAQAQQGYTAPHQQQPAYAPPQQPVQEPSVLERVRRFFR